LGLSSDTSGPRHYYSFVFLLVLEKFISGTVGWFRQSLDSPDYNGAVDWLPRHLDYVRNKLKDCQCDTFSSFLQFRHDHPHLLFNEEQVTQQVYTAVVEYGKIDHGGICLFMKSFLLPQYRSTIVTRICKSLVQKGFLKREGPFFLVDKVVQVVAYPFIRDALPVSEPDEKSDHSSAFLKKPAGGIKKTVK
jgi:hypothetical protein